MRTLLRRRPTNATRSLPSIRRRKRWQALLLVGIVFVALVAWLLLNHKDTQKKKFKTVPVVVSVVKMQPMPLLVSSIGNVTPINSVSVKSRVDGNIVGVHFKEGDFVQAGQLLFSIDPRPLQAALAQAQANVLKQQAVIRQAQAQIAKDQAGVVQAVAARQRDIAQMQNASTQAARYATLVRQGAVSAEQYGQMRTNYLAAAAVVQADQAAIQNAQATVDADRANLQNTVAQLAAARAELQNARVQLGYTSITSPISGRTGLIQVLLGNAVRANQDNLVVVNQITPIDIEVTVPEQRLGEIKQYAAAGSVIATASQPGNKILESGGTLKFLDNTVDPATGTVKLKTTFANAAGKLWPGQFVNLLLQLAVTPNAIVVPSNAVQTGQHGPFVFVVRPDNTVIMQPVVPAQTVGNLTSIRGGLRPGQTVVIDGQLQLGPGAHVRITPDRGL